MFYSVRSSSACLDAIAPLPSDVLHACSSMIFESVGCSVLMVDAAGYVTYANRMAAQMMGYTAAEFSSLHFRQMFRTHESATPAGHVFSGACTNPDGSLRGAVLCKDGGTFEARAHMHNLCGPTDGSHGQVVTLEDLTDLMQMNACVDQVMRYEPQTGLLRPEMMIEAVDAALRTQGLFGRRSALLEIEIDEFSRISESLGFEAGDVTLRDIGTRLQRRLGATGKLSRNSRNGFFVLLHGDDAHCSALQQATALARVLDQPVVIQGYSVQVTASMGIGLIAAPASTRDSVYTETEIALRRSKSLGGNQITVFEPAMLDWHTRAVQTESQLRNAITRDELFVAYQPQFCLQTGALNGVEALVRWNSPERGLVMPNDFIPLAEETGIIVPMGEWVLRTACREIASLQRQLGRKIVLAVNVSPKQVHTPGFHQTVLRALKDGGLEPDSLEIEITERLLINHEGESLKVLTGLQKLGVSIAMDDFGMGFCNLNYITRLNVNRLKIDRSFVSRCTEDRSHEMITSSILSLAKSLGIQVVAEGIETVAQANKLGAMQCDSAQGYLFSRPTTLEEVAKLALAEAPVFAMKTAAVKTQAIGNESGTRAAVVSEVVSPPVEAIQQDAPHAPSMDPVAKLPGRHYEPAVTAGWRDIPVPAFLMPRSTTPARDSIKKKKVAHSAWAQAEPRDPVSRPTYPARAAGARKVGYRVITHPQREGVWF